MTATYWYSMCRVQSSKSDGSNSSGCNRSSSRKFWTGRPAMHTIRRKVVSHERKSLSFWLVNDQSSPYHHTTSSKPDQGEKRQLGRCFRQSVTFIQHHFLAFTGLIKPTDPNNTTVNCGTTSLLRTLQPRPGALEMVEEASPERGPPVSDGTTMSWSSLVHTTFPTTASDLLALDFPLPSPHPIEQSN